MKTVKATAMAAVFAAVLASGPVTGHAGLLTDMLFGSMLVERTDAAKQAVRSPGDTAEANAVERAEAPHQHHPQAESRATEACAGVPATPSCSASGMEKAR